VAYAHTRIVIGNSDLDVWLSALLQNCRSFVKRELLTSFVGS
jgi:hypothetical protein